MGTETRAVHHLRTKELAGDEDRALQMGRTLRQHPDRSVGSVARTERPSNNETHRTSGAPPRVGGATRCPSPALGAMPQRAQRGRTCEVALASPSSLKNNAKRAGVQVRAYLASLPARCRRALQKRGHSLLGA